MFDRHGPTAPPPLIDVDYLARLGAHIGAEAARDLVAGGIPDLADLIDRLAATAISETAAVARLAHEISGAAATLGLARLAQHAARADRAARANRDTTRPVAAVLRSRPDSLDALRRWCGR